MERNSTDIVYEDKEDTLFKHLSCSSDSGKFDRSMASILNIQCGTCEYDGRTKNANIWCTNCEEGFCEECEKSHKSMKVSRGHDMISIEDYRRIHDIIVNMNCEVHGKKLDLYCKKHDTAVCAVCIPTEHKACSASDVISIDEASKHAKQSTALSDLEETILRTLEHVKYCITDREIALENVDKDEKTIRKTIADTRMNLNKYLDELERKLILDLKSKQENYKSKYYKIINQLKQKTQEIENMREQILQMKRFATDLQVFLGTRKLNETTMENIKSLKEEMKDQTNTSMELEIHHIISSLMEVRQFGEIKVVETKPSLQLKDAKIEQAQTQMHTTMENIRNISLQLKHKIHFAKTCVFTILPDDRIIISLFQTPKTLLEYNNKGKHIRDIPMSEQPVHLTAVDTSRIAVTFNMSSLLEIIDIDFNSEKKNVQCSNWCCGISYQDQKLYVVVQGEGIVVMDLNLRTLYTINVDDSCVRYITTTRDRVYYTDMMNDTIHCCSITGQEIWVFKDKSIIKPMGISGDIYQNVFVVGEWSNNLTLIQHDGKDSKVLLSDCDGLDKPQRVYYSIENKSLCVGYSDENVALYKVS